MSMPNSDPTSQVARRLAELESRVQAELERQTARAEAAESRLQEVGTSGLERSAEQEVHERCARMLADAERRATEIVEAAQSEAKRITNEAQQYELELLKAVGAQLAEMGEAYRAAMQGAREVVRQLADACNHSSWIDLRDDEPSERVSEESRS